MLARSLFIALAVALAGQAGARCLTSDRWTGNDKTKHFLGGAALGSAGTLVLGSPHKGFVFGAGAGAGVEAYSAVSGRGVCTLQDALVTAAGAAVGAYGTGWLILPQRGGLFVGFVKPI